MNTRARRLRYREPCDEQSSPEIVSIVDDNNEDRDQLREIVESVGHRTALYSNARDFLECHLPTSPGCLLLDLRMPGMDGLELQDELLRRGVRLPIVFVTAFGEVSAAVQAMRAGAVDFLEKPCRERELLNRVEEALRLDSACRLAEAAQAEIQRRFDGLSPREREVLHHVIHGEHSKQIAGELDISVRTVDVHRSNIMHKLKMHSLPQLFRLVMQHDLDTQGIQSA